MWTPAQKQNIAAAILAVIVLVWLSVLPLQAQFVTATVATGTNPKNIAVNPVTNTIYVANRGSDTVTVINGLTNATSTVTLGGTPVAIAVNPETNNIHVSNSNTSQ